MRYSLYTSKTLYFPVSLFPPKSPFPNSWQFPEYCTCFAVNDMLFNNNKEHKKKVWLLNKFHTCFFFHGHAEQKLNSKCIFAQTECTQDNWIRRVLNVLTFSSKGSRATLSFLHCEFQTSSFFDMESNKLDWKSKTFSTYQYLP